MLAEMRMRTVCFARAPQRCTNRLSKHLLLTFQEVTLLSKTRNQLHNKTPYHGQVYVHFGPLKRGVMYLPATDHARSDP
jgi:hypothetical protein